MSLPEITLSGENIFNIFGFPITNTFASSLILSFGIFISSFLVFRKASLIPGRFQNFFELGFEKLYGFIDSITGSREKTKEIFPITASLFSLILLANLTELIPGIGVFHFLRSPSSDLNFTLALSLFSMVYINILALKRLGFLNYGRRFFHKNPIFLFAGILEGVAEISRVLSLAIRLFGNLFAGEILLIVISFLFAYILPLPFLFLEIIVGFIQAFIFSSLIVIFYATSTQLSHEH